MPTPADPSVLWLFQRGLTLDQAPERLKPVLDAHGIAWREIEVRPFEHTLPEIEHHGPVICMGSTALRDRVVALGRPWSPGVYYRPERFAWEAVRAGYGDDLLNAQCEPVTVAAFMADRSIDSDTPCFLRIHDDSKQVPGGVNTRWGWRARLKELLTWEHGLTPESLLLVSPPQEIETEWRVVLVAGKAVAASSYKNCGRFNERTRVPPTVTAFAERLALRYAPAPVFVLDVASTAEGLRVVEVGCFNCAGLYACDVESIVLAVTAYEQSLWTLQQRSREAEGWRALVAAGGGSGATLDRVFAYLDGTLTGLHGMLAEPRTHGTHLETVELVALARLEAMELFHGPLPQGGIRSLWRDFLTEAGFKVFHQPFWVLLERDEPNEGARFNTMARQLGQFMIARNVALAARNADAPPRA